jgi:hypothetical protein
LQLQGRDNYDAATVELDWQFTIHDYTNFRRGDKEAVDARQC